MNRACRGSSSTNRRYAVTTARTPPRAVRARSSDATIPSSNPAMQRSYNAVANPSKLPKWWDRLPRLTPLAATTACTVNPSRPASSCTSSAASSSRRTVSSPRRCLAGNARQLQRLRPQPLGELRVPRQRLLCVEVEVPPAPLLAGEPYHRDGTGVRRRPRQLHRPEHQPEQP